jgi:Family of unknown function (DUF5989)
LSVIVGFLKEFGGFLRVRKKFWLLPICIIFVLFAGLILFTEGSAIAPFVYVLF